MVATQNHLVKEKLLTLTSVFKLVLLSGNKYNVIKIFKEYEIYFFS